LEPRRVSPLFMGGHFYSTSPVGGSGARP